jgi:acetyl esterase/lipase
MRARGKLGYGWFLALLAPCLIHAADVEIPLWPEGVPGLHADASPTKDDGQGRYTNIHYPTLTVLPPPAGTANGTAIIYAPGGGYQRVSSGVNGGIVVKWLHTLGIAVYLLKYRHDIYPHPAPLQDALRAVRLLRSRAGELGIKHLGMLGGSAGGHLTASAGTLYDAPEGRTGAELDKVSGRPDFMVLIFPMITMRDVRAGARRHPLLGENPGEELKHHLSVDEQVTKNTPPAFLVHSAEDRGLVEGSVLFSTAMRRAGAPIELHIYTKGPHGDGMTPALGPISEWPRLCEIWMRANGWLPAVMQQPAR